MLDHYAVIREGALIGTIERMDPPDNTRWGFFAVDGRNGTMPVPLHAAIQDAVKAADPERSIQ